VNPDLDAVTRDRIVSMRAELAARRAARLEPRSVVARDVLKDRRSKPKASRKFRDAS
jgi:hypothetical protein